MLNKISSYAFALLGMIVVMSSCKKDYESIQNIDQAKIQEYISRNNVGLTADPDGSGAYYQILTPGSGNTFGNKDSVLYKVSVKSLLNGTVYYSTPANTNIGTFVGYTNGLISMSNATAVRSAIQKLKPGGSARIVLPSYLGFGKNGNTTYAVPSNEILDITIETYPETTQRKLDDRLIKEYLAAKGLTATAIRESSGVYYIVVAQGTGTDPIDMTSSLKANYTGRLLDGTVFDSSTDGTFSFTFSSLATNWDVLTKFTKGAKLRLFIPSSEAYGTAGTGAAIPANAVLDFDVEIVEVTN